MDLDLLFNNYATSQNKTYADSSMRNYKSHIKKLNNDSLPSDLFFLKKNKVSIMKKLKLMKLNTRKSYLITISTALKALGTEPLLLKYYDKQLLKDNNQYKKEKEQHYLNENEAKNWSNLKQLKKDVLSHYKKELTSMGVLKDPIKESLTKDEILILQKYLVSALYLLTPALRSDYIMDIIYNLNDNNKKDNFLYVRSDKTKYFILNNFKTQKSIGSQKIKVPSSINKILNIWIKYNKERLQFNNSLLLNSEHKSLTSNGLVKLVPNVFLPSGKHITISLLRKIWISEKVDGSKAENNKQLAKSMLHSSDTQYNTYYKIVVD